MIYRCSNRVISLKLEILCPISRRIDPCRYSILGKVVRHKREVRLLSTSLGYFRTQDPRAFSRSPTLYASINEE